MKKLKYLFLRKYIDVTATLTVVFLLLLFFLPIGYWLHHQEQRGFYKNLQALAMVGSTISERLLLEADKSGVNIWDAQYRLIGYPEFKADFCEEGADIDLEYFKKIAWGDKKRYHTDYDQSSELSQHIRCIQGAFQTASSFKIRYAELIDRNGYVPWHGYAFMKCKGDYYFDIRMNREKRKWSSAVSKALTASTNKNYFVHVTDYGEKQYMVIAPVDVGGKFWGYFVIAYDGEYQKNRNLLVIASLFFLSALLVGALFNVVFMKVVSRLHTATIRNSFSSDVMVPEDHGCSMK